MIENETSLVAACKDFFGPKPKEQSGVEFLREFRGLTPEDQKQMKEMLVRVGYKIKD